LQVTLMADALTPRLTGISRYTWELCKRVPTNEAIDRAYFIANGRLFRDSSSLLNRSKPKRPIRLRRWFDRRRMSSLFRESVVHGPNYFLPPTAEAGVVTVHDLSVFRYPELHPADRINAFEREFESSLTRARHIITDSETVRREVINDFRVPEDKITSIALGVGPEFRRRSNDELVAGLAQFGLAPGEYGLCVSTLEPRKKIAELLNAWGRLPDELRRKTPLVIAGGEGWLNEGLHEQIKDASSKGWLKHLGYVPEPTLPLLYAGASLFIYPSIYEGFGLPPLEAMASGVPVIVANRSCLPEVCGDAARYTNPDDDNAFLTIIRDTLEDESARQQLVHRGLHHVAGFDWERCVEDTVSTYLKVDRLRRSVAGAGASYVDLTAA
jgi:alpha-1,3-rhamnosyl/mannosyltransferase